MYNLALNPFCVADPMLNRLQRFMGGYEKNFSFQTVDYRPRVDIFEDRDNIYLSVELPGVTKENVNIKVNDENMLVIEGEKKQPEMKDDLEQIRCERRYGSFSRSFMLSDKIDKDSIKARFDNGVLEITLAKKESAKPRDIEIQ
jgi:HSP20 family protein